MLKQSCYNRLMAIKGKYKDANKEPKIFKHCKSPCTKLYSHCLVGCPLFFTSVILNTEISQEIKQFIKDLIFPSHPCI